VKRRRHRSWVKLKRPLASCSRHERTFRCGHIRGQAEPWRSQLPHGSVGVAHAGRGVAPSSGVSACGDDSTYPECIGAARFGDVTYHDVGFTNRELDAVQDGAVVASCDSVRRKGTKEALRDDSAPVEARVVPGYSSDLVIAVQVTDSAWSVLVSTSASKDLHREIRDSDLLNAGTD